MSFIKKFYIVLLLTVELIAWLTLYALLIMKAEKNALTLTTTSNLAQLEDKSFKKQDIYNLKQGWPSINVDQRQTNLLQH